jgi:hypothetical protein
MSGSYRFLVVATGGLALVLAAGIGAYFGSLYAPDKKHYQAESSDAARGEGYRGPTKSLPDIAGVPGPVERVIANPQPETGQDHEKRDLAAQEASALWAFWMTVSTALTVAITAVGTALLFRQISLTRKAVEDTSKATEAMAAGNDIARAANRAWLSLVVKESVECQTATDPKNGRGFKFLVDFDIKNHGPIPATDIRFFATVIAQRYGDPIQPAMNEFAERQIKVLTDKEYSGGYVLFPGQEEPTGKTLFIPQAKIDEFISLRRAGFCTPRIIGCVTYRTLHAHGILTTRFSAGVQHKTRPINFGDLNWWIGEFLVDGPVYIHTT